MCVFLSTLSIHPTLSFPHCVYKCVLHVCVSVLLFFLSLSFTLFTKLDEDKKIIWELLMNCKILCTKVKVKVAQLCPTLCDPMDYIESTEFSRPENWSR